MYYLNLRDLYPILILDFANLKSIFFLWYNSRRQNYLRRLSSNIAFYDGQFGFEYQFVLYEAVGNTPECLKLTFNL